jgi:hypothetical protein
MASAFSKALSDKFLEWFADTHTDVSASSDGAAGLLSPLKFIMKMNALYACASDNTTLCSNIREFLQDCPVERDMAKVTKTNTGLYALLNNSTLSGSTIFYVYDAESGQVLQQAKSCQYAGQQIYLAMSQYAAHGVLEDLIGKSTAAEPGEVDNGEAGAMLMLQGNLDNIAQKLGDTTGADSTALMVNLLFCHTVQAGWQTSSAKADPAVVFSRLMSDSRAKAAMEEAGSSSMFESFMTSAMNLFSFLFVATAPIIILVAMVMGMAGVRVYGSWLLFGVWSQSWLPVANLISFYMMSAFWSRLAEFQSANMFGCQNVEHFYHQVASVIYTGASMMASVPIMTLSLISGSMVAMSSLAGRATGGGRGGNPGQTEPQHDGNDHAASHASGTHAASHTDGISHAGIGMVRAANAVPIGMRHSGNAHDGQLAEMSSAPPLTHHADDSASYWDTHPMMYASNDITDGFAPSTTSDAQGNAMSPGQLSSGASSAGSAGNGSAASGGNVLSDYSELFAAKGKPYKDSQIASYSHYYDPIDKSNGRPAGNSRIWGDAPESTQREAIDALVKASRQAGLNDHDTAYVLAIARHEAGFNPDAAAGTTSASGLGQFTNGTGSAYGVGSANRWDVNVQANALVRHYMDNQRLARSRGQGEEYIYKYHHDGPSGEYGGLAISNQSVMPLVPKYEKLLSSSH